MDEIAERLKKLKLSPPPADHQDVTSSKKRPPPSPLQEPPAKRGPFIPPPVSDESVTTTDYTAPSASTIRLPPYRRCKRCGRIRRSSVQEQQETNPTVQERQNSSMDYGSLPPVPAVPISPISSPPTFLRCNGCGCMIKARSTSGITQESGEMKAALNSGEHSERYSGAPAVGTLAPLPPVADSMPSRVPSDGRTSVSDQECLNNPQNAGSAGIFVMLIIINIDGLGTTPPEELYATQLSQLREMGFFDTQENLRALIATNGNVHAAVERLLGSLGQ